MFLKTPFISVKKDAEPVDVGGREDVAVTDSRHCGECPIQRHAILSAEIGKL